MQREGLRMVRNNILALKMDPVSDCAIYLCQLCHHSNSGGLHCISRNSSINMAVHAQPVREQIMFAVCWGTLLMSLVLLGHPLSYLRLAADPGYILSLMVLQAMFHQANMGTAGGTTKSLLQRWVHGKGAGCGAWAIAGVLCMFT
jgi:hypothetical protein